MEESARRRFHQQVQRGRGHCPWCPMADAAATTARRSPTWRSLMGGVSDKVSSDQMEDECKDHIGR
jgi:hypothetical protein